jgi:hypothetical protein
MNKEEFYIERKKLFKEDFEEFKKTQKSRQAVKSVAEKNNVTEGLAMAVIYNKTYLKKTT